MFSLFLDPFWGGQVAWLIHRSMLNLLMVWLLGWLRVHPLGFLKLAWCADDGEGTGSLSSYRQRLFPCGLKIHVPLAGLLPMSRDKLVGTTQGNFAAGFASAVPRKCRNLPPWCSSAVLGICQCLQHRLGIKKEMKWPISAYKLHFLLPPINIETQMGRNSSGASEQALHPTPLSCVL